MIYLSISIKYSESQRSEHCQAGFISPIRPSRRAWVSLVKTPQMANVRRWRELGILWDVVHGFGMNDKCPQLRSVGVRFLIDEFDSKDSIWKTSQGCCSEIQCAFCFLTGRLPTSLNKRTIVPKVQLPQPWTSRCIFIPRGRVLICALDLHDWVMRIWGDRCQWRTAAEYS